MKVLHILDSLNRGGAETLELDVCRNASENGLDLNFAATGGGTLEEDFKNSGVPFFRLQRHLPIDFAVVRKLRKIIKTEKINVVHTHQAVEGLHAFLAVRRTNVKLVLTFHGGTLYDWKNHRTLRFLIPRTDANVVVSESLKKWHEKTDKFDTSSFKVIYNGVDEKRLAPTGKSLKKELGLANNVRLIGMIGNFYNEKRKDQMTLCKALPKIFAEFPNVHCVFAGKVVNGAEEKQIDCLNFCLENKIADRVHFLGGRSDVPDILSELEVFVFSSFHEGLPIAACEAMLAKVPLIISDIKPLLEISENGKFAEVFPLQNDEILSEKIVKLLKNNDLREDVANRAFQFAKENFSIEAHLRELKKLYEKILNK